MTSLERIRNARIALLLDEPFFGALLMHLRVVADPACPTFSTNGRELRFNVKFLDSLDDRQLRTILAHEVLHCALLHIFRRGARDLKKFNVAADYAINNFLDNYNTHVAAEATKRGQHHTAPFVFDGPLAAGCLDHAYDGLSAEEIYNLIPEPPPQGGGSKLQGAGSKLQVGAGSPGSPGNLQPSTSNQQPAAQPSVGEFTDGATDEASAAEAEAEWKVALKQAAVAGKSRGRLPAEIERLVTDFLEPKVHWRELLRRFLTSSCKDDYSFTRPNRRYSVAATPSSPVAGRNHHARCILPGLHSPKLGRIVCAVDTSGSIDQKQFNEFIAEVRAVLFDCRPEALILAQCDAHLHDWQELDPFAEMEITCKGGGGTCFKPVFERALAESEPPVALIYLTDLAGSFPDYTPPFPVLWAVVGRASSQAEPPFGEVLSIE